MDKEKDLGYEGGGQKEDYSGESSSRARNKTVMLTPEMTSQVRSRFQQEADAHGPAPMQARPSSAFEQARSYNQPSAGGFEPPASGGGFYSPGSRQAAPVEPPQHQHQPVHSHTQTRTLVGGEGVIWIKEAPVVGFLVSYDSNPNGTVFELRSGRLIVTNQPSPGENTLVVQDSTVSSMHAIIRVSQSGEIQVLDQLSEFGTKIKRFGSDEEESLSGEKSTVDHGDVLSFGNRNFHVCIVPRGTKD